MSDIAREVLGDGGRWREVFEANKEILPNPNQIMAGMTLVVSRLKAQAKESPKGSAYLVSEGDTLYSIASQELGQGSRWREIVSLNGLDSEHVLAGTRLTLPTR